MREGDNKYEGKKRALIISISKYDKLEPLDFCEKDGNKIYEVLTQLEYYIPVNYRLIGGRIEYDRLRDSILDFFSDPTIHPKDTIICYFSGHRILGDDGEHYLSTSEIDPDRPRKRGFSFDELSKAREECNSRTIFTILDCCYSGADKPGGKGPESKANDAMELLRNKSKMLGEGKCILTACKPMQKAYEYKKEGHSYFTFYLAKALCSQECADEDGNITPYKINEFIDEQIRSLPYEMRPKQTPLLNCSTSGKIILARFRNTLADQRNLTIDGLLQLLAEERVEEFNRNLGEKHIVLLFNDVDLTEKKLIGAKLHEADLTGAKLVRAKLSSSNLIGAKLKSADLKSADLQGAILEGANLTQADLTGAVLTGANLSGANLTQADLTGAVLTGANLSGANLAKANLTRAALRGADLKGMVNFEDAKLYATNFGGASIQIKLMNFNRADIRDCIGLPYLPDINDYGQALKSFSEGIIHEFKADAISPEKSKLLEEKMEDLLKEVETIEPEQVSEDKKKSLRTKFADLLYSVIEPLPKSSAVLGKFSELAPFSKLIGEDVQLVVEQVDKDIANAKMARNSEKSYKKGLQYASLSRDSEAIYHYDEALEMDPLFAPAWISKGLSLDKLGKYDVAIECYNKALLIDRTNVDIWNNRGLSLSRAKKYTEAIESFKKALAIDPAFEEAKRNIEYVETEAKRSNPFAANIRKIAEAIDVQTKKDEGMIIMASSGADSFARERTDCVHLGTEEPHAHGVFSYYLIEGLNGKAADRAGVITTRNLMTYVEMQMLKDGDKKPSYHVKGYSGIEDIKIADIKQREDSEKRRDRRAIIIGINQYQSPLMPTMRGAENDAREIFSLLIKNGNFDIKPNQLLLGPDATRINILKALSETFRKQVDYGLAVLYFSGHVIVDEYKEGYIVPFDFDPDDPFINGISLKDLKNFGELSLTNTSVLIILDCSYSGIATTGTK